MKEEIYQMENIFNLQKKQGGGRGGGVKFVKLAWNQAYAKKFKVQTIAFLGGGNKKIRHLYIKTVTQ